MTILQVADLGFGYGATSSSRASRSPSPWESGCALVAPNGAGKSTLLRLIGGELPPDRGSVVIRRDARVGYYRQSHELSAEGRCSRAFLSGFREMVELRQALDEAQHEGRERQRRAISTRLAHATDALPPRRTATSSSARSRSSRRSSGFEPSDMARPVASLSGGERGRLHLGVVLAQEPDLLMLDEPTNHLDLDTIAWLEQHLVSYRGAVLVVSHDRAFLDAVARWHDGARAHAASASIRCATREYAVAREADLARERELAERQQALRRQDRRLHPQEHRRAEDQAGAEPPQDARQARSGRSPRGRVGASPRR